MIKASDSEGWFLHKNGLHSSCVIAKIKHHVADCHSQAGVWTSLNLMACCWTWWTNDFGHFGHFGPAKGAAKASGGCWRDHGGPQGPKANNAGSCTRRGHHVVFFPFFSRQLDGTIILVGCSSHASEQPATQVTPPSCLCRTGSAWRHPLNKPSGQISSELRKSHGSPKFSVAPSSQKPRAPWGQYVPKQGSPEPRQAGWDEDGCTPEVHLKDSLPCGSFRKVL